MKKLFLLTLIISQLLYAQNEKLNKIGYEINLKSKNSGCFNTNTQNEHGYITGILLGSREGIGTGVSNKMDWFFLNQLSEYSWAQIKSPDKLIGGGNRSELFNSSYKHSFNDYTINYSFYPLKIKNDSIWVYCKYVIYEKKEQNGLGKYSYDVAFREDFLNFPFNEETKFELWKSLFPLSEVSIKFFFDKESAQNKTEEIPLAANEAKITSLANRSNLGRTNLKLGMELLRMNAQSDKIILQKNDYPLNSINKFVEGEAELKTTVYSGMINLPLKIYNPEKITAFESSKFATRNQTFILSLVPISKEGNDYSFDVLIKKGIGYGSMSYEKRIKIMANNKVKLEIQPTHMTAEDIIDGERFVLNLDEDYNAFVKDYLIISLEANQDYDEDLLNENAQKSREALKSILNTLAVSAQEYCNKKNKGSFSDWSIPNFYNLTGYGTFSSTVEGKNLILFGIGKEKGADGINPVKVRLIVSPISILSVQVVN